MSACGLDELTKLNVDDIEDKNSFLIIKIPDSIIGIQQGFVIDGETTN